MFRKLRLKYHLYMAGVYLDKVDKKRIKFGGKIDFVALSKGIGHQDKAIKLYNKIYNESFISAYDRLIK